MRRSELAGVIGLIVVLLAGGLYYRHTQHKATDPRAEEAALRAEAERVRAEVARTQAEESFKPTEAPPDPRRSANLSLSAGVAFLLKRQSPDGAWRSDVYATFKDGPALTPLAVRALQEAGEPGASAAAVKRGCEYLAKLAKADGTIRGGEGELDYPVYTAALTVQALTHEMSRDPEGSADLRKPRDAWLKYLLDRQLTEKLGWNMLDKQYGGWGYCRLIPKKPPPNEVAPPLVESNLSATVFALEALAAAGVTDAKPYQAADMFLRRCQNEDGGFHFIYDDPVRNKAGSPDPPGVKPTRFYSYGSTTADGVRGLLITEPIRTKAEDEMAKPVMIARGNPYPSMLATRWLEKNFSAETHPGKYVEAQRPNREAVYFYYAASVAKALRAAKVTDAGGKPWAAALASELGKRQQADGSWANHVELVRENDPLVATANAVIALAQCRDALSGH